MVRRNLSLPHRIACVTDLPLPPGVEQIIPPGDFEAVQPRWGPLKPNCFRRLAMFRRDAAKLFGERFVCMDLDCVVGGPLDPLFNRKEDLVLFNGTSESRPYNGSMMLIRAGCRPELYEKFSQAAANAAGDAFLGSDQAWLSLCLGWGEATWGEADGAYWWGKQYQEKRAEYRKRKQIFAPRVLFFPGKVKPWTLAELRIDPFVTANYRRVREREAA